MVASYAGDGDAETLLQHIMEAQGESACYQVAEIYALAGDIDSAFTWLARAIEAGDGNLMFCLCDPILEALESDPRWEAHLEAAGLGKALQNS